MMKKYILLTIQACIVAALSSTAVYGQSRSRSQPKATAPVPRPAAPQDTKNLQQQKKRPVVVTLKEGGPVNGNFVEANNGVLNVEVAGNILNINLDDVVSISFSGEVPNGNANPVNRTGVVAGNALRALRKMASATEVGISYQEYGSRLIDLKTEVDEAISQMSDGELKTEISLAMEAYADASVAWSTSIKHGRDTMFPDIEPATSLIRKYSLPIDTSIGMPLVTRSAALNKIWGLAKARIERASALLSGETPTPLSSTPSAANQVSQSSQTSLDNNTPQSQGAIVGSWRLEVTGANKDSWTFDIKEDSGRIHGILRSQTGQAIINTITVRGNEFEFAVSGDMQGQYVHLSAKGNIEGHTMRGTMSLRVEGGISTPYTFTGTRIR
jgi:hypothetical protein